MAIQKERVVCVQAKSFTVEFALTMLFNCLSMCQCSVAFVVIPGVVRKFFVKL